MSAVQITNLTFGFTSQSILKDVNVSVPYGKIYSLLGPSGAGKTTLLRLVLGRIKPSSGHVIVLGDEPGVYNRIIGYMPQDTALCASFTVAQTLQYFANIYRLSSSEFIERTNALNKVLSMPEGNKKVGELSGGQQKMVSLAITFLHQPRLLILDEPTVGSDPVLGNCIWKYLHQCCQQSISVIIVTHYIEEAGLAHIVGIMRNGTILEEGSPSSLIHKYQTTTLEEVFLYLCNMEDNMVVSVIQKQLEQQSESVSDSKSKPPLMSSTTRSGGQAIRNLLLNCWILSVLVRKNLARFFQFNISFLIFLIPAFQALILCTLYNRSSVPVNTAVFNQERAPSALSHQLLESIEKVDIYYVNPIPYDSLEEAIDAITQGRVIGAMWFPPNFTDALETRITDPETVDNQTLRDSSVRLFLDNSNFLFATGLMDSMRQTVYRFLGDAYSQYNESRFEAPIDLREVIYAQDSKLSDFLLPGYLISFMYLSQVSLSSQLLIQERNDGLFERSLVAGVGHHLVFLSHFLSSSILSMIQITLMLFVSLFLFNITNFGAVELIFALVFAQAANSIATGLLISSIFNEGFVAILASIFVTFSQLFSSGSIFPMELVEPYLRKYLYFCPIALPTESLRNVMLRGWTLTHPYVYNGLMVNLSTGFILSLVAALIFRRYS